MTRRALVSVSAVAFAVAAVFGGHWARAFWTTIGSGAGTGAGGAPLAVTVTSATGTPSSSLYPGASADLVLQFTNPNSYPVTLTGVAQNGTVTPVGGASCSAGTTGVSVPTRTNLSVSVAAGTNVTVHVDSGVSMDTTSASGCQGASFRIPVTVTLQR